MISVDPINDFNGHNLDNVLSAQGLRTRGRDANTIILYPSSDGTANDLALLDSNAASIEHGFNLATKGIKPEGHSGAVTLFDPQGNLVAQSVDGAANISKLLDYLPPPTQKQR